MPSNTGRSAAMRVTRFARISSLTVRERQPDSRSSAMVAGRPDGTEAVERTTAGTPGEAVAREGQRGTHPPSRQTWAVSAETALDLGSLGLGEEADRPPGEAQMEAGRGLDLLGDRDRLVHVRAPCDEPVIGEEQPAPGAWSG